jgi:hypothetical protein
LEAGITKRASRSWAGRGLALAALLASGVSRPAFCQAQPDQPAGPTEGPPTPPGLFRLGPVYLTPTFHLGSLGLDTNVFYTPTSRTTDFTTMGGPGLDLVMPIGSIFRVYADGEVDYVYFLRTKSQRRFGGDAHGGIELKDDHWQGKLEEAYSEIFQRPSYEVDERIVVKQQDERGELTWKPDRFRLTGKGLYSQMKVDQGQVYDGTDLGITLTRNETLTTLEVGYDLTTKTSLLVGADYELDRFPFAETRDADSNRIYGGFQIDSKTRLAGRAVGGVRLFRPTAGFAPLQVPYADVALMYTTSPRTQFLGGYTRDLSYSAFQATGAASTLDTETVSAGIDQALFGGFDLRLSGSRSRLTSEGIVTVVFSATDVETAQRDDTFWQAGANLGYKFRSHLRIGLGATYSNRKSTFADFGIRGFIVGATVNYDPQHPDLHP